MKDEWQTPIQVVGIGLEGAAGLSASVNQIVNQASVLVGSQRQLSYFPNHPGDRIVLGDLATTIAQIRHYLCNILSPPAYSFKESASGQAPSLAPPTIAILTSGDPLFFGLGRLLLAEFPAEQLTFHPHLSCIQLAFNRLKIPWQDARIISAHGRSLDDLTQALQQGVEKIAVLTDLTNTPAAIAQLIQALDLPSHYQLWICENLGGDDERIVELSPSLSATSFAPLNVVILLRSQTHQQSINLDSLPLFGLPDGTFLSFSDRPGLMTKREVRILALGELALQPGQVVWDIGAGTGTVAIEIARLCPTSSVYAVEKTAIGNALIHQNCQKLQVENVYPIQGIAPDALDSLPIPDRIFIGGSGGNLTSILECCTAKLNPNGVIVLALATLEHQMITVSYLKSLAAQGWRDRLLQVQLARSTPIAKLTRLTSLNPVVLVTLTNAQI